MTAAVKKPSKPEPKPRRPLWRGEATQVTELPESALTVEQVASQTGLRVTTVLTAVYSTSFGGQRSRMRSLSRPKWDVNGIPHWAPEQVKDYFDQIAARQNVRGEFAHLKAVDKIAAIEMQCASLHGISRTSSVPVTTLYAWKLAEGFPLPVAIMEVGTPTPRLLYSWPDVRKHIKLFHGAWLRKHPEVNLDERMVTEP